jgi:hypothetical protein
MVVAEKGHMNAVRRTEERASKSRLHGTAAAFIATCFWAAALLLAYIVNGASQNLDRARTAEDSLVYGMVLGTAFLLVIAGAAWGVLAFSQGNRARAGVRWTSVGVVAFAVTTAAVLVVAWN